jgi:hypothetical protein
VARARAGTPLTIALNGCTLYSGPIEDTPWFRTFSLRQCPGSTLQGTELRITLTSPTVQEKSPGSRKLGVAIETVNLLDDPWPPAPPDPSTTIATVEPAEPVKKPLAMGSTIDVEIANRGESVWLGPGEATNGRDRVDIVLRWRRHRGDGPAAEQRMALPHTFYPEDRTILTVPVVVPEPLRRAGPWELTIAPVFEDGRPIKVEPRFMLAVEEPTK